MSEMNAESVGWGWVVKDLWDTLRSLAYLSDNLGHPNL